MTQPCSKFARAARLPLAAILLALLAGACWAAGPEGHWTGTVEGQGVVIRLTASFTAGSGGIQGTMDVPQQGATGLALRAVRFEGDSAHFELVTGGPPGVFDGKLAGDVLAGAYVQGKFQGTFNLTRTAPAEAVPPPPYREEEVSFANGDVTLAGTLTVPPGAGPHPALVMVTGSGPQNRDEELFGFKPFRLIADHLSRRGIAVLRYDDRGTAKSTGTFASSTTEDFAGDAQAAVRFLKSHAGIDPGRIGVCGHSEGGLIAPLVAVREPGVAFIVLMAGPGVDGGRILLEQSQLILQANGVPAEERARQKAIQQRMYRAVRGLASWDSVRAEMMALGRLQIAALPDSQRKAMGDQEAFLAKTVDSQIKGTQSPWMKFFLTYDPAPTLEKVRCPVLALFGEKDLQVPAVLDSAAVGAALAKGGNPDHTLRILPRANHLFLGTDTGNPAEYAKMNKEFVPEFLPTLAAWVQKRCGL